MAKKSLLEIKADITEAIEQRGPFSHNLVSINLRIAAREYGNVAANRIIAELELHDLFGIKAVSQLKKEASR
ncbi:MAG: hypothetical protein UMS36scaffold28_61 [Phage 59_13]|nr:MAG: hypothetical protein UMS36scaffold28_61 [Phage 59_13]